MGRRTTAKAVCWLIEVLRMSRLTPKIVRRRFFVAAGHALHLTWPVLSIMLAFQVALGLLIVLMVRRLHTSEVVVAQA
jgi:hypothetical protein